MLPTLVLCGLSEVIGWAGRVWSAKNPYLRDPFLMQYVLRICSWTTAELIGFDFPQNLLHDLRSDIHDSW